MAEGDECIFLPLRRRLPALGPKVAGVRAPDLLGVVDGVGRNAQDAPRRKVVAVYGHTGGVGGHLSREANSGRRVMAERLIEHAVEVRQVADHVVCGNIDLGRDGSIHLGLQLLQHSWCACHVVEEGARRVGRGVAAGNQLRQSLSGELLASQRLALVVATFHQARQQILSLLRRRVAQSALHARNGNAGQVLDGVEAVGEEGVGQPLGIGLQLREAAKSGAHLAATVQDLNGRGVDGLAVGRCLDLGNVCAGGEHAKGCSEGEVADDIKGQVVEPRQTVDESLLAARNGTGADEVVELLHKQLQVAVDVRLKLRDGPCREGVGHKLSLARVLCAIAGIEETATDGNKGIVEFADGILVRQRKEEEKKRVSLTP